MANSEPEFQMHQSTDLRYLKSFVCQFLGRVGYTIAPQFFQTFSFFHEHATPYLDGIGGLAAIGVFNYHFLFAYNIETYKPWVDIKHRWVTELLISRLLFLGLPMLNILLIVGGYVIVCKSLRLMHSDSNSSEKNFSTHCVC